MMIVMMMTMMVMMMIVMMISSGEQWPSLRLMIGLRRSEGDRDVMGQTRIRR